MKNDVKAILVNSDGKVLIGHRPNIPGIGRPDTWSLFGGRLEKGETEREAIIREVEEETGHKPLNLKVFNKYVIDGLGVTVFLGYFDVDVSDIVLTEEDDCGYFTYEEALKLKLSPFASIPLKDYFKK